jgi:hypothetical protein
MALALNQSTIHTTKMDHSLSPPTRQHFLLYRGRSAGPIHWQSTPISPKAHMTLELKHFS